MLLHRKNESREASAEIADAIALAGGQARRLAFAAVDELRVGQHALQRRFDAVVEAAAFVRVRPE